MQGVDRMPMKFHDEIRPGEVFVVLGSEECGGDILVVKDEATANKVKDRGLPIFFGGDIDGLAATPGGLAKAYQLKCVFGPLRLVSVSDRGVPEKLEVVAQEMP